MKISLLSVVGLALTSMATACGGRAQLVTPTPQDSSPGLTCGPGTMQAGNQCVVATEDGGATDVAPTGTFDAGAVTTSDATANGTFTPPPDAGSASGFAIDPAHDDTEPDAAVASPLTPAWTVQFTGAVSFPVVVGNTAIVAAAESQANVRALDLASGVVVWGPIDVGAPVTLAAEGTTLVALDSSGELTALDSATGAQRWATQLQGQFEFDPPPVALGGLVYVNGLESGGTTYAIDEKTGATVWTAETFDGSFGTVAVSAGVVYEAEACDQVSAFDAVTGALKWYYSTSCTGGGGAAPSVYQGSIWVRDDALGNVILDGSGNVTGSFKADVIPAFHNGVAFYVSSGTLTAVEIQSKTEKWSFSGDAQLCTSAVVAAGGGQVFVGSSSGHLYELDEATGVQKSVTDAGTPVTCGSETQSIALAPGRLLVPAGNTLVAY